MKILPLLLCAAILSLSACNAPVKKTQVISLAEIETQLDLLDQNTIKAREEKPVNKRGTSLLVPRNLDEDGSLKIVHGGDWTSGFYPGTLWYMFELTGDEKWKERATKYTEELEDQQYNASNHDVGFRMFCSYGNALRLTEDSSYIPVLIASANTLISRYYEGVGCIRSWDFNDDVWMCPVIIDNMMNLELLFWASRESGDQLYYDIAVSHAKTTMANHFRDDYSTVHVVDYDTITGDVRQRNTHQGFADESSWARGQAWGLYGYVMTYRFTQDESFLSLAEHIAGFILDHPRLPEDLVPYWDFDAPGIPDVPRDASAAAIIASALYELSGYSEKGELYREKADAIMESLGSIYISEPGTKMGFILDHATGNLPGNSEIDVPLNYADYYYMEARVRQINLKE